MDLQRRHVYADHCLHAQRALAAALFVTLAPVAAWAQVSVEVTPLRVELKAGPGGTHTQTVALTNHDASAVRIHARVDDWYLSKDGTPQFMPADGTSPFSAAAWVRVNPVEQVIQPGASSQVRFTTTAPTEAAPGGYRAAIMFDLLPAAGDAAMQMKGVRFQSRVATLIYLTVGSPQPHIEIVDVQPGERGGPPSVVATLKNTGRVHVRTKGQVVIYDKAGTAVRRVAVPDVPVLPESERDVHIRLVEEGQQPLDAGEYRVEVRIDVGLPELLIGETTVTIGK